MDKPRNIRAATFASLISEAMSKARDNLLHKHTSMDNRRFATELKAVSAHLAEAQRLCVSALEEIVTSGLWEEQGGTVALDAPNTRFALGDALALAVQQQHEYIEWLCKKHNLSMADCSPNIGTDEDGSDLGGLGVTQLEFNARVALKQYWSGELMSSSDGGISAAPYADLLKEFNKERASSL